MFTSELRRNWCCKVWMRFGFGLGSKSSSQSPSSTWLVSLRRPAVAKLCRDRKRALWTRFGLDGCPAICSESAPRGSEQWVALTLDSTSVETFVALYWRLFCFADSRSNATLTSSGPAPQNKPVHYHHIVWYEGSLRTAADSDQVQVSPGTTL